MSLQYTMFLRGLTAVLQDNSAITGLGKGRGSFYPLLQVYCVYLGVANKISLLPNGKVTPYTVTSKLSCIWNVRYM